MFGNAYDALQAMNQQQAMNSQLQYLNQLQGIGQQAACQPIPATAINPDDRLIVLLTEV